MKWLAGLFLIAALLFIPAAPSQAQRGGHVGHGGGHGFSRGSTHQVWHGGGRGGEYHGGHVGAYYRHGGTWHGGWHGGWYGRGWHGRDWDDWGWRGRVIIGGPWWWGWPYAYGYPYAYSYSYPYYPPYYDYSPPLVQGPSQYVQQAPVQQAPQGYWYYCASAKAYYPTVSKCPEGWIKVPPAPQ